MTQGDPLIGLQLGAYLIQSKVGEGGMASVYKAYHARLKREVAIKVITPLTAKDPGFQLRFEREAQVVAKLEHHNLVAVYDFGESENLTYLVMQYVGGGTLRDQLVPGNAINPRRAAHYALQIARALHHAHSQGIVHRDVKPQNILISATDPNHVLLSDFGIAKLFDMAMEPTISSDALLDLKGSTLDPSLTSVDQIIGTAEYMAPEQIHRMRIDARTDVYALGVVLFQMLAGRVPFQSSTLIGLLYQQVHNPPPPLREINAQIPESLIQITEKALQKNPARRYQSTEEMAQALEATLASTTNQFALSASLIDEVRYQDSNPHNYILNNANNSNFVNNSYSNFAQPAQFSPSERPTNSSHTAIPQTTASSKIRQKKRRSHPLARWENWAFVVIAFAIIALLVQHFSPGIFNNVWAGTTGNPTIASFNDTFANNEHSWPINQPVNGLDASIDANNHAYNLKATAQQGYFLVPGKGGILPADFQLKAEIATVASSPSNFYGLLFRYKQSESKHPSGYAFLINGQGDFQLRKYLPDREPDIVLSGSSDSILKGLATNLLQVTVHQNTYAFQVNNQQITLKDQKTEYTDSLNAFTDGSLGIYVSSAYDTSATFRVTLVDFAIL